MVVGSRFDALVRRGNRFLGSKRGAPISRLRSQGRPNALERHRQLPNDQLGLEPEEKARLLQAIEEGIQDYEKGDHMDAFEFLAQLRAKREAADR